MDARTLIFIAVLFMLLNSGVLWLMRNSLAQDVRPAASDWLWGMLLMACGLAVVALRGRLSPALLYPLINGTVMLGAAFHYRAVRRFCRLPDLRWNWTPAWLGVAAICWLTMAEPSAVGRILASDTVLAIYMATSAWTLFFRNADRIESGSHVLAAIFAGAAAFFVFRSIHLLWSVDRQLDFLTSESWMNAAMLLLVTALPVIGTTAFLLMCADRLRIRWERAAVIDDLTGLPNRRRIMATGVACFEASRHDDRRFAVAVIDIDHFKTINDRYGHEMGDRALQTVAAALDENCRGPHLVGRYGGEEFVLLLENVSPQAATQVAERLRTVIEAKRLPYLAADSAVTVSVGIGFMTEEDRRFDDVLRRADRALYVAKSDGRNRVVMQEA